MNSIILLTIFGVLNLFVGFRKSNKLVLPLVFLFLAIVFAINLQDWNDTRTYFEQMLTIDNFAVAFTAVVVLTLGIAIGANVAFYSVVEAVLLRYYEARCFQDVA